MWYYARGEEQFGPLEDDVFARLTDAGSIGPDTLVWREGMTDWVRYGSLASRGPEPGTAGGAVPCAECRRVVPAEEAVAYEGQWVCGSCKDVFFQRLREGNLAPASMAPYASVLARFGALLLDSLIFAMALGLVLILEVVIAISIAGGGEISDAMALVIGLTFFFGSYLFLPIYMTWFVGRFGATPGKMALKLRIVRGDGDKLTYLRAFGRTLGFLLSCNTMYLGFIVAFFDNEKRALHDFICDTRVIDAR